MPYPGTIDTLFITNSSALSAEVGSIQRYIKLSLGEPTLTVELTDDQINLAFERAIMTYSSETAKFKAKNSYLSLLGIKKTTDLSKQSPMPSVSFIKRYVAQFGTDANSGGNLNYNKGYIDCISGETHYDLKTTLRNVEDNNLVSLTGQLIPKRVFHSKQSTGLRYYDPMYSTNLFLFNQFDGHNAYQINGKMLYAMPMYENLLRFQWFENFDKIFKSQFSWNVIGTDLTISPKPKNSFRMFIEWIDSTEFDRTYGNYLSNISDESVSAFTTGITDIPFNNLEFGGLNDFSKNWIREYTLAVSKEMLGLVRGKMQNLPLPDTSDMQLNYAELLVEGKETQNAMKEELREFLDSIISSEALKRESDIIDVGNKYVAQTPLRIYKR